MSATRSIPLLLPLLFAIACGSAKPASGPESKTSAGPPAGDTETTKTDTATSDAVADPVEKDAQKEVQDEKSKDTNAASPPPPAEGGPAPGKAAVEKPLSGALSQDDIRNIMMKNGALFDSCYSLGGDKSKQLVGTVKVQATIGPSGNVNEVKVLKSTMKNQKVDTCVADAFRKIKFPPPSTGATSVITFPINFEGVEVVKK